MDLFRGVVLFIIIRETIEAASFVIPENAASWTTASERCTLAEPEVKFSSNETTVNIPVNITDDVWIGYYRAMTAFEYFGCAAKDKTKTPLKTRATPGHCMSACDGQKIIGIFENDCYCFGDDEMKNDATTRLPYCNILCTNPNDAVCGGKNTSTNTTYISLYRSLGIDKAVSGNGSGNCMIYNQGELLWDQCSKHFQIICGLGNSVWIGNDIGQGQTNFNWAESNIKCFQNKARPSTYCNTHNFQTSTSSPPFWTGIMRSQVFYKRSKYPGLLSSANAYVYLTAGNSPPLRTVKQKKEPNEMKYLCVNDTHSTEISQPYVTPTVSPTIRERCEKMDDMPSSDVPSSDSASVGAAVGATLSVLALIAIVVTIVLVLRKRGVQLPFLKKEKPTYCPSISSNNAGYAITGPVVIQHNTYTTSQDDYAELDLKTMIDNEGANSAVNNASETPDSEHNYSVIEKQEEEPYDTTKPTIQKSFPDTYNPYNKLNSEESSGYDQIGNCKTRGGIPDTKTPESENAYNTTSLENSKLKTSAGESNNAYNMTDDTDDAYNHINIPPQKTRRPENDYDIL